MGDIQRLAQFAVKSMQMTGPDEDIDIPDVSEFMADLEESESDFDKVARIDKRLMEMVNELMGSFKADKSARYKEYNKLFDEYMTIERSFNGEVNSSLMNPDNLNSNNQNSDLYHVKMGAALNGCSEKFKIVNDLLETRMESGFDGVGAFKSYFVLNHHDFMGITIGPSISLGKNFFLNVVLDAYLSLEEVPASQFSDSADGDNERRIMGGFGMGLGYSFMRSAMKEVLVVFEATVGVEESVFAPEENKNGHLISKFEALLSYQSGYLKLFGGLGAFCDYADMECFFAISLGSGLGFN